MADDLRHRYAEALATAADFSIIGEWICCEPINLDHDLCVKGDIARQMLRAVLADDPDRLFVPSGLVGAVMAVRDEELERLRAEVEADDKAISDLNTNVTLLEKRAAAWRERAENAEAKLLAYESADSYVTSCTSCAGHLDRERRQEERAEDVERRLAEIRRYIDEDFRYWCSPNGVAVQYAKALLDLIDRNESQEPERG